MDADETAVADLVARHRAGDPTATDGLVGLACRRLERVASRMLASFPDVARWERTGDVLQGAMIRLHRALGGVELASPAHFWNLAGRTVRRELLDLAAKHRGPLGLVSNHDTDDPSRPLVDHPAPAGEPSSLAEWAELLELVDALPDDLQAVFDLLAFRETDQAAAAAVLGVDVRTVRRRWQKAKRLLRAMRAGGEA